MPGLHNRYPERRQPRSAAKEVESIMLLGQAEATQRSAVFFGLGYEADADLPLTTAEQYRRVSGFVGAAELAVITIQLGSDSSTRLSLLDLREIWDPYVCSAELMQEDPTPNSDSTVRYISTVKSPFVLVHQRDAASVFDAYTVIDTSEDAVSVEFNLCYFDEGEAVIPESSNDLTEAKLAMTMLDERTVEIAALRDTVMTIERGKRL